MGFAEWRENRKAKKEAKRDPYDILIRDLKLKLLKLDSGTEAFEKTRKELNEIVAIREKERDSKRKLTKQDKGGIIIKVLSILGAGAGIGSIIWAEKQDMVFTGEKRSIMDAISRGIGNILVRK